MSVRVAVLGAGFWARNAHVPALRALPDVELVAGGGVRDAADLRALAGAGTCGALVATALHRGAIGADELR